eukprot:1138021-Pelagomonas_calceolata.AAC.3
MPVYVSKHVRVCVRVCCPLESLSSRSSPGSASPQRLSVFTGPGWTFLSVSEPLLEYHRQMVLNAFVPKSGMR